MEKINLQRNAIEGLIFGLGTGGFAAAAIWGSRYVSKLPNLPLKSALVVGGSSFIATVTVHSIRDLTGHNYKISIIAFLVLGSVLTAVGNKKLVNHNIPILSSLVISGVSQTAMTALGFVYHKYKSD